MAESSPALSPTSGSQRFGGNMSHSQRFMGGVNTKLSVTICAARQLKLKLSKDMATPFYYVVLSLDKQEVRTRSVESQTCPEWNDKVEFDVTDLEMDLRAVVYNERVPQNESAVGVVTIPIAKLFQLKERTTDWYVLKGYSKDKPVGEIRLEFDLERSHDRVGVDSFDLLTVIGKGSFGKVIQVRKKDTQRVYAMKILRKDDLIARQEVEHTRSEQNVLRMVRHPFIVGLKYSFQTEDKLYMVMDYVNGGELFYHLKLEVRFDDDRTRFYAAEIIHALEYVHKLNIVYRDLKPENILLDMHGHVCLTDFGLCKEGISDGNTTNTFCGTAEYLAPEVLEGKGYGMAVDWWSLGTLMYEMLTGLTPFYSSNTNVMYKKILVGELRFPDYISADARSLLQGLLERDPSERLGGGPSDAEEIKSHPYFRNVDWAKVLAKKVTPPFTPKVSDSFDTSNIDPEFTQEEVVDSYVETTLNSHDQAQFGGFTYVDGGSLADGHLASADD